MSHKRTKCDIHPRAAAAIFTQFPLSCDAFVFLTPVHFNFDSSAWFPVSFGASLKVNRTQRGKEGRGQVRAAAFGLFFTVVISRRTEGSEEGERGTDAGKLSHRASPGCCVCAHVHADSASASSYLIRGSVHSQK